MRGMVMSSGGWALVMMLALLADARTTLPAHAQPGGVEPTPTPPATVPAGQKPSQAPATPAAQRPSAAAATPTGQQAAGGAAGLGGAPVAGGGTAVPSAGVATTTGGGGAAPAAQAGAAPASAAAARVGLPRTGARVEAVNRTTVGWVLGSLVVTVTLLGGASLVAYRRAR